MNIDSKQLIEIMRDWSYWEGAPTSWSREIQIPFPSNDLLNIISGVRRCGKSTLMAQLIGRWNLEPRSCFFVNFEDPRLVPYLDSTAILDSVLRVAENYRANQTIFLFLDEIQNVTNWQKWVRLKVDRPGDVYLTVSGSNSVLLSGELGSTLTGRHRSYTLYPLSFTEYRSIFPSKNLTDYLTEGGFPRALSDLNPRALIQQYYRDITERDLRERLQSRSVQPIQSLVQQAFEAVGSEISIRKLAAKVKITADSASSYLHYAEQAFLLFACSFFEFSERKRLSRNKKYYAIDTALRRSVVTNTGEDFGKDFENIVYLHLRRSCENVYYWSGSKEVDFVVQTKDGYQPVQVSFEGIKDRHELALEEFYLQHPNALNPLYVTAENFSEFCLHTF